MATTTPTVQQQILTLLSELLSQLENDALTALSGPVLAALNSIITNSSGLNIAAQVMAMLPALLASFVAQQGPAASQAAATFKQIVQLLPQLLTPAATPAAS